MNNDQTSIHRELSWIMKLLMSVYIYCFFLYPSYPPFLAKMCLKCNMEIFYYLYTFINDDNYGNVSLNGRYLWIFGLQLVPIQIQMKRRLDYSVDTWPNDTLKYCSIWLLVWTFLLRLQLCINLTSLSIYYISSILLGYNLCTRNFFRLYI